MPQTSKILLLTRTPPGSGSVGEIVLRDQLLLYPRDKVSCLVVESPSFGTLSQELDWLPIYFAGRVSRSAPRTKLGFLNSLLSLIKHQYHRYLTSARLVRKAITFARAQGAEVVWVNLNAPITIYIAKKVAKSLGIPLLTTVWDPPERFVQEMDTISGRLLLRDFDAAIRASTRCAVISEEMQDNYREKYGVETVILRHGIDAAVCHSPATDLVNANQLVIGFAGSQYTNKEWQALIDALDRANWRVNSREVRIRVLGSQFTIKTKSPASIEFLGWRSTQDTGNLLSKVDVLYLPYMFDSKDSVRVKQSFPTKLTTYLSTGRPVLFHGPLESAPARFLREYAVGYSCHSLAADEIIDCLSKFTRNDGSYGRMTRAGKAAFDSQFTRDVFRRRFAEFIGVEPSELMK